MTHVLDVARYILEQTGPITAMKLQKLVYYSQAWSLAWDERPLFPEQVEAWRNGPVVPELYAAHRGLFQVDRQTIPGDPALLDQDARETVDLVLEYYLKYPAQYLSDLTHMEDPWKEARADAPEGGHGNTVISHASMAEYYQNLPPDSMGE